MLHQLPLDRKLAAPYVPQPYNHSPSSPPLPSPLLEGETSETKNKVKMYLGSEYEHHNKHQNN
jgi:hypothetical protein